MTEHQDETSVTLFDNWYAQYFGLVDEVDGKDSQIKQVEHNTESFRKANSRLHEECNLLQKTQDQCQQQLNIVCELEDELRSLKTELLQKEQDLCEKDKQNKTDIENVKMGLKKEYEENTVKLKSEYEEHVAKLEKNLRDEEALKSDLELQLTKTLRDKDREISRITMEYESKLAQGERQKAQLMQQQQQVLNQDVMRRKIQHMKETHEKELALLKSKISDLQVQGADFAVGQPGPKQQSHWQQQPNDASPGPNRGRVWSKPNSRNRNMSMSKRSF